MQIKVGDLVYIKAHSSVNIRQDNDIWLVLGKGVERAGSFSGFIRIQNIRNGKRVQYNNKQIIILLHSTTNGGLYDYKR